MLLSWTRFIGGYAYGIKRNIEHTFQVRVLLTTFRRIDRCMCNKKPIKHNNVCRAVLLIQFHSQNCFSINNIGPPLLDVLNIEFLTEWNRQQQLYSLGMGILSKKNFFRFCLIRMTRYFTISPGTAVHKKCNLQHYKSRNQNEKCIGRKVWNCGVYTDLCYINEKRLRWLKWVGGEVILA